MISDSILRFIVEDDDEEPVKDILGLAHFAEPSWEGRPEDRDVLYDELGRQMASSRNLRGLRTWVRQYPIQSVEIRRKGESEHSDGAMLVRFMNGWYCVTHWSSYSVLTNSLRNWRNLEGAKLIVNGQDAGKIGYRNPALQEAMEEEELADLLGDYSLTGQVSADSVWKQVASNRWVFQQNSHQRLDLSVDTETGQWTAQVMFDEMYLSRFVGNEEEMKAKLREYGYMPGEEYHQAMVLHNRSKQVREGLDDEDDMKDVTLPGHNVQVNDEQWSRYGHDAVWSCQVEQNKWWKVGTTAQYPDFSVGTPYPTKGGTGFNPHMNDDPDPAMLHAVLSAVVVAAKEKGFDRVSFVKSTPRVYDAMEEAVGSLEKDGLIKITGYSGAVIQASLRGGLGEAMEDEDDLKDVIFPNEELTLSQIKALAPDFFDRKTTKFFGTKQVYKYPGNYIVLKNVKAYRPATAFGHPQTRTSFVIYQLTRNDERPDLLYKGEAADLDEAKDMIKRGDFRTRLQRAQDFVREGMEDDPLFMELPRIESVHVVGRNWWRRGAGGNYYRADIYVNGEKVTTLPEQGGSDQQYLYDAFDWLESNGYIQRIRSKNGSPEWPRTVAERLGFKLSYEAYPVKRERDL